MESTLAFVLRQVSYRESDKILTLMTRTMGKLGVLARGARKSSRRVGGALEPYSIFEVTLATPRRGSLLEVREAVLVNDHQRLATDLLKMGMAAYLIELSGEVCHEREPNETIFDTVAMGLALLEQSPAHCAGQSAFLQAALKLIAQMGVGLGLDACTACGKKVPAGKSRYVDIQRGGVICTACGGGPILLPGKQAAQLETLSDTPLGQAHQQFDNQDNFAALWQLVRAFITYHLEKELKSTPFLDQCLT